MAFTVSHLAGSVFGNLRVKLIRATADATTGVVDTGLAVIESLSFAPCSMTSAGTKIFINANASGTATNGTVAVTSVTSGDVMFLTVYGR